MYTKLKGGIVITNNTIFDDVFRTMVEKLPKLTIPLINEVFGTSYREDEKIIQLRNEHQDESGEVITDSCLRIQDKLYHIECQSTNDTTMAVRMIEYDFHIALEHMKKEGQIYRMEFPRSCVLYIRSSEAIPDYLKIKMILPDEQEFFYRIPTIQSQSYALDMIFQKRLFILLPYYIMRYEKQRKLLDLNKEKLDKLLAEYTDMRKRMEETFFQKNEQGLYTDLCALILRIVNYIFTLEQSSVRKGIGDIMGGKVLELYTEERYRKGQEKGIKQGMKQGMEQGILKTLASLVTDGVLTIAQAAQRAGMSVAEFQKQADSISK